jgi:uncharacterized protein with PIN domain
MRGSADEFLRQMLRRLYRRGSAHKKAMLLNITERWLDDFMKAAGIRIEPVTLDQAHAARSAHLQFGEGDRAQRGAELW